jgi:hypothetical protein
VESDLCHGNREREQAAFDFGLSAADAKVDIRRSSFAELSIGVRTRFVEYNGNSEGQESVDYYLI